MLANPRLAPFELIEEGTRQQWDWTLIDHLMQIHRVKESDYVVDDPITSILNMARTLASIYLSEDLNTRFVVLVKDGASAPKPSVRESRLIRTLVPHIEFCKLNLHVVEYTAMKLLADAGMKDKLFLVTGAKGEYLEGKVLDEMTSASDNLISFHQKYLDGRRGCKVQDNEKYYRAFVTELFEKDPYICVQGARPRDFKGVFVATFADPTVAQVSTLAEACIRCASTEADTLLVELANILKGSVAVCTGDTDMVAVLAACGREGITLRLDNKSYRKDRDMYESPFGELFATPEQGGVSELEFCELGSSEDRFSALCDVSLEDMSLVSEAWQRHNTFEVILDKRGETDFKVKVARYLYVGGIRGPLYCTFLFRFLESNVQSSLVSLGVSVHRGHVYGEAMGQYVFETLCPATSNGSPLHSFPESDNSPTCTSQKRRVSHLELDKLESLSLAKKLKRLGKAYMKEMVPRGSYGRFLRLSSAGRHFFMRITEDTVRNETVRMEKLFFMALCGTDYNLVPTGLGIKRLMTGVLSDYDSFSLWCRDLKDLLWGWGGEPSSPVEDREYHKMGRRLSCITNVPIKTCSKHWTVDNCKLMVKTIKYVCDLWNLKKPKPGPDYGLCVHDGMVSFSREDSSHAEAM